ncbi:putative bifunctional diguanylate cyclase/phosphodiesterase [Simiduia agarivorans]|uniref:Signal transduction protein n=1 Tax=Simiduia agarivorans (strain DSM 21679 / JCM 13881 / BCRC 17597 / SA1) TaxID=1117647 RepID=K4L3T0_SIMAS|nr:GGDEF domain-containing phosphodiesterase [Simiduia agarivorans]AFV00868.1 signal transduction protein [Simiduia agarivorans SA1 = DSM 21679]
MPNTRLFSLATKAQLLLTAFLALSLLALLYFHWQEQNRLRETELTETKLKLANQLNASLVKRFQSDTSLLQQWVSRLPAAQQPNLVASLLNDWALLRTAGGFDGLQLYNRDGSAEIVPGPEWPAAINADWINAVYRSNTPQFLLACSSYCSQFVGIPIRLPQQPSRIMVSETRLDAISGHLLREQELTIYLISTNAGNKWTQVFPLLGDTQGSDAGDLQTLLETESGPFNTRRFHHKLLPIPGTPDIHWLLATDEEAYLTRRLDLLKLQLVVGLMVLVSVICASWLVSRHHLRRLYRQINTLRLLADQQFDQARARLGSRNRKRIDELDLLGEVAADLTYQLEATARSADSRSREMERLALYDPLTNLPNRNLFVYEVQQLLDSGQDINRAAILVIDVDKFQRINDSLGHQSGDLLLSKVADRIRAAIGNKDFCARLSGNIFGVLIPNLANTDLKIRINKISEMVRQPLIIKQQKLIITVSMGMAPLEHGTSAMELLRNAEIAMYRAKQQGGNSFLQFTPEFKSISRSKVSLEAEIHRALEQKEFRLYLQSKVDMSSTIRGFEALCRWDHPDKGVLAPQDFVPVMTDLGLQSQLDKWMLEAACRQLKTWQNLYPDVMISVNVASDHFSHPSFLTYLQQTINRYGIKPGQLELEITETLLMENITLALQTIEKVKALGVSIAIDDFGTGYSSLSYLKNLPVDTLKIDREFIKDIPYDESDMHISAVIIFLARQLGFKVVAEGVETSEQLVFLKANHCDLAQGYLFSKPIPAHKAMIVLESQRGSSGQAFRA